jgi:tRNA 2-selenouridine synthase SelU
MEHEQILISKRDAENLLDVLQEWEEVMGAKELSVSDVGLDWERYEEMRARLKKFTGSEIRDLSPDVGDGR